MSGKHWKLQIMKMVRSDQNSKGNEVTVVRMSKCVRRRRQEEGVSDCGGGDRHRLTSSSDQQHLPLRQATCAQLSGRGPGAYHQAGTWPWVCIGAGKGYLFLIYMPFVICLSNCGFLFLGQRPRMWQWQPTQELPHWCTDCRYQLLAAFLRLQFLFLILYYLTDTSWNATFCHLW